MKHLFLRMAMIFSLVIAVCACTKSEVEENGGGTEGPDETVTPTAKFTLGEPDVYNVDITLESVGVIGYAYMVTEELEAVAPDAAILFAEGTVGEVSEATTTISVNSLEGGTEYKIFICAQYQDALGYGDVVELESFVTEGYADFVTVLPADDMYSVKMHINVPKGKTMAYFAMDLDDYHTWQGYATFYDAFLFCFKSTNESIGLITESQVVTCEGFAPGQPVQIMVAEVVEIEPGVYEAIYDYNKYSEDFSTTEGIDHNDYWLNEFHYSEQGSVTPPELIDAPVGCEVVSSTTQSVSLQFTMHDDIDQYVYSIYESAGWEYINSQLGEDGAIFFATAYADGHATDDLFYTATKLEAGVLYKAILIGRGRNSDGTKISVNIVEFSPAEPTEDAPKMKVTAITAPNGVESPFKVWFNVKCETKDACAIKYLCNDRRAWTLELNEGQTYQSMMNAYGQTLSVASVMAKINSDDGYNMGLGSLEDATTRFVVIGINSEETESSAEDENSRADNTTISIPDAERVESDLFEELKGEWTATAYIYDLNDMSQYEKSETPRTGQVSIGMPIEYPDALPQDVYDAYPTKTKAEVDALFEEFKLSAAKFEGKVRGQNRLLCAGSVSGNMNTGYSSPFALFYDEYYTVAITTDDIFFDFGPKWFLQIHDDGSVTIPIDPAIIPPFNGYSYTSPLCQYAIEPYTYVYNEEVKEFEVEISEDKNTITLLPKIINGVKYCYSAAYMQNGFMFQSFMCDELVLTRNTDAAAVAAAPRRDAKLHDIKRDVIDYEPSVYRATRFDGSAENNSLKIAALVAEGEAITIEKLKSRNYKL